MNHKESLIGKIDLQEWDLMKMITRDHQHQPHPTFEWVWIYKINERQIPPVLQELIKRFQWESLEVFSVLINNPSGIPEHQHTNDCEMYFGGNPFATMFVHNPWESRQDIKMDWRSYSVVIPGWTHGIITDIETRILAVKFKTSKFPPLQ